MQSGLTWCLRWLCLLASYSQEQSLPQVLLFKMVILKSRSVFLENSLQAGAFAYFLTIKFRVNTCVKTATYATGIQHQELP